MTEEPKKPRTLPGRMTVTEIREIADRRERKQRSQQLVDNPELTFLAPEFVQCTFPHSDPKANVWIRTNNLVTLMVEGGTNRRTGKPLGLPSGLIPRYLMIYLNRQAVKTQKREIELGRNLDKFMREVLYLNPENGSGKRSDYRRMVDQVNRTLAARITITYDGSPQERDIEPYRQMLVTDEVDLWWNSKQPDVETIFTSTVTLTEKCFDAMVSNPVPIELKPLQKLGRSPLAIDLYCWIGYRLFLVNQKGIPARIPLRSLQKQFGSEYADTAQGRKDFNKKFRTHFDKVAKVYENAKYPLIYDYEPGVINLYPRGTALPE